MESLQAAWLGEPEVKALIAAFPNDALRFVGGAVRDTLLGLSVQDIDAATTLAPEKTMQHLQGAGIKAIPTGIDHGTITALINGRHFEITTLRKDVETDGRHAVVAFTDDWKDDAARRDFTMNALYLSADGTLTNYFGGAEDAKSGRVIFIGDATARIQEDGLRILRFFRFFAKYGKGDPDQDALQACKSLASMIDHLSGERIQQEMFKLLVAPGAANMITLMQDLGVLKQVMRGNIQAQPLAELSNEERDPILALATLLRGKTDVAQGLAFRWKLSKADAKRLNDLIDVSAIPGNEKEQKMLLRKLGKPLFVGRVLIALAHGEDKAIGLKALELADHWQMPIFPVSGDDLIAQGITPGKEMGVKLKLLEEQWETSDYRLTKEQLLKAI